MDSITIERILSSNAQTNRAFQGCYPCDLLPSPLALKFPAAFIVNFDPHQMDGSHWVAIYAYGIEKEVIYFDSLALPVNDTIQATFLSQFPKTISNSNPFQNPFTDTCAHYCICFVYFLSNGYTFDQFIRMLPTNSDSFVRYIVNRIIA